MFELLGCWGGEFDPPAVRQTPSTIYIKNISWENVNPLCDSLFFSLSPPSSRKEAGSVLASLDRTEKEDWYFPAVRRSLSSRARYHITGRAASAARHAGDTGSDRVARTRGLLMTFSVLSL